MSFDTIAVATDFSARADRAIDRAKQLQSMSGAKIRFIHATNLPDDDPADLSDLKRKMRQATGMKPPSGSIEFVFPSGLPTAAIAQACADDAVSLLVIGPARYNSIGDFFLGTAVDYVLRKTTKPVLVAKTRAHEPYRQIVAGTDFSPGSARAIITAAQMFPDVAIHIVHAWHVPFSAWQKDKYVAAEVEAGEKKQLADFVSELAAREPILSKATSEVFQGSPAEAIRRGIDFEPASLVVLGSHGQSGFSQIAIGSVTSDLLRVIEADTLVVNAKGALKDS